MKHGLKALPHQSEPPLAEITLGKAFRNKLTLVRNTDPRGDPSAPLLLLIFKLRKEVDGDQESFP